MKIDPNGTRLPKSRSGKLRQTEALEDIDHFVVRTPHCQSRWLDGNSLTSAKTPSDCRSNDYTEIRAADDI
jgi:hypothetical protein